MSFLGQLLKDAAKLDVDMYDAEYTLSLVRTISKKMTITQNRSEVLKHSLSQRGGSALKVLPMRLHTAHATHACAQVMMLARKAFERLG